MNWIQRADKHFFKDSCQRYVNDLNLSYCALVVSTLSNDEMNLFYDYYITKINLKAWVLKDLQEYFRSLPVNQVGYIKFVGNHLDEAVAKLDKYILDNKLESISIIGLYINESDQVIIRITIG